MTIHGSHPFADPDPDPARRLRGRLGGPVSLWTAGPGGPGGPGGPAGSAGDRARAGLTVTSVMLAGGESARLLALLDPDADLTERLEATGRGVVQLLSWRHRDLAEVFAGLAPSPGGPFRAGTWESTDHGPRLADATTWALVSLESAVDVGWSRLVTCVVEELYAGDDDQPLLHRRGRYGTLQL